MKQKLFVLFLALGLLLTYTQSAHAWNVTPQKITFTNEQNLQLEGWLFKPTGSGPFPAVVMMHGCSGVYSYSNPTKGVALLHREWGDRLVAAGYVALLVDSFTTRGTQNECGNGAIGVSEVNDRPYDAYAAYDYLEAQSFVAPDRVGLMGWSHGGSSTMASMDVTTGSAFEPVFAVAVAFYPGCGLYNAFGGLANSTWLPYAPFRILHGSHDTTVSPAHCQTRVNGAVLLGASAATGNPTDLVIYQGAHHSFDMAKQVGGNFTIDDVNAKIAADQETMNTFALYLQP